MIGANMTVTIDDTTVAQIAVDKAEKIGMVAFTSKTEYSKSTLLFTEAKAVDELISILTALKIKMEEIQSGIILPDKTIKTV